MALNKLYTCRKYCILSPDHANGLKRRASRMYKICMNTPSSLALYNFCVIYFCVNFSCMASFSSPERTDQNFHNNDYTRYQWSKFVKISHTNLRIQVVRNARIRAQKGSKVTGTCFFLVIFSNLYFTEGLEILTSIVNV